MFLCILYGTNTTLTIDDSCYLHCLAAVSEIPILDRKEFVPILLWRNLNWKFLILVLAVHNLGFVLLLLLLLLLLLSLLLLLLLLLFKDENQTINT